MVQRDLFISLEKHLNQRSVTVITGMRRVGKSTAVKFLLQKVNHTNKLYLDCERIEIRTLLNRPDYESIVEELQLSGLDFTKPCVLALDEIQLVKNLPSFIKYVYDTYSVKFIVTGSSSYYMKNQFSESLAGRKQVFEMYPLSFKEFLNFKKTNIRLPEKYAWKPFNRAWFNKCKKWYEEYVEYGGFPEVVLASKKTNKEAYLRDIINSYIELDIKLLSDYSASEELYNIIKLLAARTGSKIDYTKLSSIAGINRQKVTSYLQLLESTYFIYLIKPFTRNIDKEISQQPKIYFSDTGILNALAAKQISSGQLFENAIAAQLKSQGQLQYFQKKNGQEIDFILDGKLAIEVKQTATRQDNIVLKERADSINIKNTTLVSWQIPTDAFESFTWGGSIYPI